MSGKNWSSAHAALLGKFVG